MLHLLRRSRGPDWRANAGRKLCSLEYVDATAIVFLMIDLSKYTALIMQIWVNSMSQVLT